MIEHDAHPTAARAAAARARILVVDDEPAIVEFLAEILRDEGYDIATATGGAGALERIDESDFDLVLTDLKMPSVDGIRVIERATRCTHPMLAIVMTGYATVETAIEALKLGAEDYITKPFKIDEVTIAVERAVEKRRLLDANAAHRERLEAAFQAATEDLRRAHEELARTYHETLRSISALLELKDAETEGHSQRVTEYTCELGRRFGLSDDELTDLWRGALLHDIGKVGIPDSILLKPGALTAEERMVMETHCRIGFHALEGISFLKEASRIVLCHQERYDGGGYPGGLVADAIPVGARLFAVADAFDAITSDRPYRCGVSIAAARAEIGLHAGTQFDPEVVGAFLEIPEDRLREIEQAAPEPSQRRARTEHYLRRRLARSREGQSLGK